MCPSRFTLYWCGGTNTPNEFQDVEIHYTNELNLYIVKALNM